MPAYTPNYNLIKPDPSENVDVGQLNANMDIIDGALRTSGGKLTILGTYPTLAQLQASVTNPSPGDAYNVGSAPPYTIYMRVNNAWQNQGRLQGADGINAYIWIKYASDVPTQDSDMSDLPDQYMGMYTGASSTPPQNYSAYVWYKIKGATGDTGRAATIQIIGTQTANPGGEAAMVEAGDSTPGDRKYIAVIPKGETGDTGTTGTIQIVMTETLMPGLPAKIQETGDSTEQNRRYAIGIPEGRKGETGFGMRVLARRDTIEDIEAEFPNREIGSQYEVGAQQPYEVYLWTDVGGGAAGWVNQGTPITSVPSASNISADDPFNEIAETDVQGVLNESGAKIQALESRTAENIPTNEGGVSVQGALDMRGAMANHTYDGVDLTVKFATEITGYGGDPWSWIRARIQAANFSGLNVGDYIPFIAGGNSIMAEVAGIDTYYNYGDTATGHHIDFISRYLWPDRHVFNKVNYNNGTSVSPSTWSASDLYAWLNSLSMSVPNSAAANPTLVAVNYTTTGVYDKLPTALKSVIVPKYAMLASRYTAGSLLTDDNSWAWRDMGKLWIPSEMEVLGCENWGSKNGYSGAGGYVQYPIFAQNARRVMATTGGTRNSWWLTTARGGYSASCGRISPAGHALYSDASATTVHVPVCFRIA